MCGVELLIWLLIFVICIFVVDIVLVKLSGEFENVVVNVCNWLDVVVF